MYVKAIQKLNKIPNVRTVGYIDTKNGNRENTTVREEIATYAGWNNTDGLAIHGIFFDRTPSQDVDDARGYLKNISAKVRHSEGFLEPKLVIHNPGVVPNASLASYRADITVVFEGAYEELPKRDDMKAKLSELQGRRDEFAYFVHSVPKDIRRGGIRKIVDRTRRDVEWLFVTTLVGEKRYEGYGGMWEGFLELTW